MRNAWFQRFLSSIRLLVVDKAKELTSFLRVFEKVCTFTNWILKSGDEKCMISTNFFMDWFAGGGQSKANELSW